MFFVIALSSLFIGCSTKDEQSQLAGSDKDEHGCIGSAGYAWCISTQQCERPWELAQKEGFENSDKAFSAFCKN
ncbi:hypothetical protein [Agaribacterium sp. ZY112]|uniref:hypothetical protein n=1 Tax=Agaribacterium sp. ZY112 TaxID=3233574 RepID=UPI0035248077